MTGNSKTIFKTNVDDDYINFGDSYAELILMMVLLFRMPVEMYTQKILYLGLTMDNQVVLLYQLGQLNTFMMV